MDISSPLKVRNVANSWSGRVVVLLPSLRFSRPHRSIRSYGCMQAALNKSAYTRLHQFSALFVSHPLALGKHEILDWRWLLTRLRVLQRNLRRHQAIFSNFSYSISRENPLLKGGISILWLCFPLFSQNRTKKYPESLPAGFILMNLWWQAQWSHYLCCNDQAPCKYLLPCFYLLVITPLLVLGGPSIPESFAWALISDTFLPLLIL